MSFSSDVKQELNKLPNLANKEAVKYELLGYLGTNHIQVEMQKQCNKIRFSTENEYNINRFSKLLDNLKFTNYEIKINGKIFSIIVMLPNLEEVTYEGTNLSLNIQKINESINKQENLQKAFIRGNFLGSGSINNPEKSYHMEITFKKLETAELVLKILKSYDITFRYMQKMQEYVIYTKDGEEISKFLAFIGANKSVLKFEEVRVYRDIRNNVNRKVNCETANLNKTVESAIKQIEAIKSLQEKGKLEQLSEKLQEIAEKRISHPEASLTELGKMLKEPIGRSGVNHRLNQILKKADELL